MTHPDLRSTPVSRTLAAAAAVCAGAVHTALAQPCSLRAQAEARGVASQGLGYSDTRDTGTVTGAPSASITASGSDGAGSCSASSTATATAAFGSLAASGSGSGVNCASSSSTLYSNASLTFIDTIQVTHATLPPGTRIPVRLRVNYAGSCSSLQPSPPFCSSRVDVMASITFGQFRIIAFEPGVFTQESSDVTVGSLINIRADFRRDSGATSPSLVTPNSPAVAVSCAHDALITVTLEPLISGVTLTACSGHNYLPTCPADFNHDGAVDPDDLADFIACYFSTPPCPDADFNADATIDPDDLADFISTFFGPPC